eukprot:tig00020830_g14477.t1
MLPVSPSITAPDLAKFLAKLCEKAAPTSHKLDIAGWLKAAAEGLSLGEAPARLLFGAFQLVASGDLFTDPAAWPHPLGGSQTVDAREFAAFLSIQYSFNRRSSLQQPLSPSSRSKLGMGDVWPSHPPLEIHVDRAESFPCLSPVTKSMVQQGKWPVQRQLKNAAAVRQHIDELLRAVAGARPGLAAPGKLDTGLNFEVAAEQFDRLAFLLVPASSPAPRRLSDLCPLFAPPANRAPASELSAWLSARLIDHEYPSPAPLPAHASPSNPSPLVATVANGHKTTIVRSEGDLKGVLEVRIFGCQDTYIYLLGPVPLVTIMGCTDCTVVLGPVSRVLSVEHCERIRCIAVARQVRVSNCLDCALSAGTPAPPLTWGDSRSIFFGPFSTHYPALGGHMQRAGLEPQACAAGWRTPHVLDWPNLLSPCAPGSDPASQRSVSLTSPDQFVEFVVPFKQDNVASSGDAAGAGTVSPGPTPAPAPEYQEAVQQRTQAVKAVRQAVRDASLSHEQQSQLRSTILEHFREWLMASGNARQVVDLQRLEQHTASGAPAAGAGSKQAAPAAGSH